MAALILKGPIKKGTVTFGASDTIKDVTIVDVVLAKSILLFSGKINNSSPKAFLVTGRLLNTTTIRFERDTASSATNSYSWQVIEFSAGITVEHLFVDLLTTSRDVTINEVDLAKAFPIITYMSDGDVFGGNDLYTAEITTITNVQFKAAVAPPAAARIACQIVEIDDATVQKLTGTTDTDDSTDVAITAVTLAKTFWFLTFRGNFTTNNDDLVIAQSDTTTNIKLTRASGTSNAYNFIIYVVEIANNLVVEQVLTTILSGDTSISKTITAITEINTALLISGLYQIDGKHNGSVDDAGKIQHQLILDSATQFTSTRTTSSGATTTSQVHVLEFTTAVAKLLEREYPRGINRGITRGVI